VAEHQHIGVLVYIWRNKGFFRTLGGSFGHVSLRLVGPQFQRGGRRSVYISWWPGDTQSVTSLGPVVVKTASRASNRTYYKDKFSELSNAARTRLEAGAIPRPGQRAQNPNQPRQFWDWVKFPDAKITLPAIGAPGVAYGLDAMAISSWWKVFNACADGKWTSVRNNCAKVAAAALDAGGASRIVPLPRPSLWRPTVVEEWVQEIAQKCAWLNQRVAMWSRQVARSSPRMKRQVGDWDDWEGGTAQAQRIQTPDDVWDSDRWRKESRGGRLHFRSAAFREIDHLLDKYHVAVTKTFDPNDPANPVFLLQDILGCLHKDLMAHPHFNRENPAALTLGGQCLAALERWGIRPVEEEDLGNVPAALAHVEPFVEQFDNAEDLL
jgi:hypothetical protein